MRGFGWYVQDLKLVKRNKQAHKTSDAVKQLHLSLYTMKIDVFSTITGFM